MQCFHLKLAVPCLPLNRASNAFFCPLNDFMVEHTYFRSNTIQSSYRVSIMKNLSPSFVIGCYIQKLHRIDALGIDVDAGEISDFGKFGHSKVNVSTPEKVHVDGYSDYPESFSDEDHKEMERRRKIGLANKGRAPWNKRKKHSAETRELIRQRTKEAMRDPKVKKKMSVSRGPNSEETNAKIGSAIRQLWIKRKNFKENFFLLWANSIAETAEKGWSGEKELDSPEKVHVDSYNDYSESFSNEDHKEMERRRKIGLASRGRVPWNKGIQYSPETRKLISQRTREAWRDPKIRKKMAQPRGRRSIAETAKKGGNGEKELDWDSYEKIERELALQLAAEKEMVKEIARIRAEKGVLARAQKQRRRSKEHKEEKLHRIDVGEISDFGKSSQSKVSVDSPEKVRVDGYSDYPESFGNEDHKEMERRRKIGLANKGRVPWNKGRKLSAEFCEKLSRSIREAMRDPEVRKKLTKPRAPLSAEHREKLGRRIREAMRDPKVRKKLAERGPHSAERREEIRQRTREAMRDPKIRKKLAQPRGRRRLFMSWAKIVAETAKKGGSGEKELDWDGYEKIEKELALQLAAEKEKAKEIARIRAEKAAQKGVRGDKVVQ